MKRFLTICCSLALVGQTNIALCAPPGTTNNQSLLAKRGLADFDLDGNGTLDAGERATVLAARNAAHHQTSLPATGVAGSIAPGSGASRSSASGSNSSALSRWASTGGQFPYQNIGSSGGNGLNAGGSYLVVEPGPTNCPIENAVRRNLALPHPMSGGSVVAPVNIFYPGSPSTTGGNGSGIVTAGNDPRIVTPSNLPHAAVYSWPQLPSSNTGASIYWVPNGTSLGQVPLAGGSWHPLGGHHGR